MVKDVLIECNSIEDKKCFAKCDSGKLTCCFYCKHFATCKDVSKCTKENKRLDKLDLLLIYAGHVFVQKV